MSKLQAIQVDDDTILYIEATDNAIAPGTGEAGAETGEVQRGGAKGTSGRVEAQMAQSFKAIESTIKTYTQYTLNAFKDAALAEVEKVTLEFGLNVSGSGGVPYIAAGTMGCNIKVTVECAFPQRPLPVPPPVAQVHSIPQTHSVPSTAPQPAVPAGMPQRMPHSVVPHAANGYHDGQTHQPTQQPTQQPNHRPTHR